jgi:hypothetical protein
MYASVQLLPIQYSVDFTSYHWNSQSHLAWQNVVQLVPFPLFQYRSTRYSLTTAEWPEKVLIQIQMLQFK